jgi:hypothetical protein
MHHKDRNAARNGYTFGGNVRQVHRATFNALPWLIRAAWIAGAMIAFKVLF